MMKIAAVSMRIKQGRCEENVRQMMRCIEEAKQEGAQLIVFPQNAVSGLQLGEMWLDDDFCRYADSFNARIAALADTIAIVWGNVRYRGSRRFNTAFFAYRGQLELRVKKIDGALENEARYFDPLDIGELIEYGGELIADPGDAEHHAGSERSFHIATRCIAAVCQRPFAAGGFVRAKAERRPMFLCPQGQAGALQRACAGMSLFRSGRRADRSSSACAAV